MTTYDYNDLADAYGVTLNEVPGLRGHGDIPDRITPPCAIVGIGSDGPSETFEGATAVTVHVLLLISKADTRTAQRKLNTYRSRGNPESVIDAMETSTVADYTVWKGTEDPTKFEIGGTEYIGVDMTYEASVG